MAVSLTDYNLFDAPKWIGTRNYTDMFTADPRYRRSVGTTLVFVVVAVPLKPAFALGIALLLRNMRSGRGFYRSAYARRPLSIATGPVRGRRVRPRARLRQRRR